MKPHRAGSETDLVTSIRNMLIAAGYWCARNNTGKRGGVTYGLGTGGPDLLALARGTPIAIEVKKPGGLHPHTEAQRLWAVSWRANGGIYIVVDSAVDALRTVRGKVEFHE